MADFLVDFEWYIDSNGFKLVPWKSIVHAGRPLNRSGDCIVANGGKRVPYRPLDQLDTLYLVFAGLKTPDQLLGFINTFGPLTPIASGWGEDVSFSLRQARLELWAKVGDGMRG
jgi:hypothetical protein